MKKFAMFIVSLVILASLVIPVGAQAPSPGSGTSYGAVQNVDNTSVASFRQDFYDQDGNLDAYREKANVAYGDTMGLTTNDTADAPLSAVVPTGWVGSSVVSSDREAAAVVLVNYIGGGIGADTLTSADYSGVQTPGSDNFCPSVGMRSVEDSTIVVMNTSDAAVSDVSISFKTRDGADAGTAMTAITIPAHAQKTYSLFNTAFALPALFLGSARVQSAGGTPLAVIAITHWGAGTTPFGTFAYNCQSTAAGATTLYAPKVQRRNPSGNPTGGWMDSSGIVVVNTEATAATARVELYDREGTFSGVFTDTVPAYSARGYNTEYYGNADHAVIDSLIGTGTAAAPRWLGSAVIKSVSGQMLVGVVKQGYEADLWAGGYNMLSDADAGMSWFFPLIYRRGFNRPWTDYIGIACQNVSATAVTPQVQFVDRRATATKCTPATTTCQFTDTAGAMAPYVSHGYNTRYGSASQTAAWFGDATTGATGNTLGNNFLGAAFITAGANIVCIQETWMEEMQDLSSVWHAGGDSNLNNVYGK